MREKRLAGAKNLLKEGKVVAGYDTRMGTVKGSLDSTVHLQQSPPQASINTAEKSAAAKKVIGRLSVIVAPGKRGEIVVRDGEQGDKMLMKLVRNFVVCYGLKKDMVQIIYDNLKSLVQKREEERLRRE